MSRSVFAAVLIGAVAFASAQAQVTSVTAPSVRDDVRACADYAEEVLLDRWDMNERTDLGWAIFNVDEQPKSFLTDISFENGLFSARSIYTPNSHEDYSDAKVTILDTAYPGSAKLGKTGWNYPIDASKYTRLALRMYLHPIDDGPWGQIFWAKQTIYQGVTTSNSFMTYGGWYHYIIDIPALGTAVENGGPWSGDVHYLRLDPVIRKDKNIKIDWIRLVQHDPALERTITWTGSGFVDIYLDDDADPANGNLGLLAKRVSGGSHTFLAGALAGGDYHVAIAPHGTQDYVYAPGFYRVNAVPVLQFTRPSAEGSDEDFVTVHFNDPWDMMNPEDVEYALNLRNPQFTTLNYEDMAGRSYTNRSVFLAEAEPVPAPGWGDPLVYFLHYNHRGGTVFIDTSRYFNLTFKMGIEGAHSTNTGSIARVIWKRNDEDVPNVSKDIPIRHLAGRWIMNKVVCDLRTLPIEYNSEGQLSQSGWTGFLENFRIDPHEFRDGRRFFFDEVRLTTDWRADASFLIEWTLCRPGPPARVSLYYDTDDSGYDGTLIVGHLDSPSGIGSFHWDTSSVPDGTYWVYAVVTDDINTNRAYAGGPIHIRQGAGRTINLSRDLTYLGAVENGVSTSQDTVFVSEADGKILSWEAVSVNGLVTVTPSSGTGDDEIQIRMATTNLSPGTYADRIRISDPGALNSPRFVGVRIRVYAPGTTSPPFGRFETPISGSTVVGAVPVTGWALDDVEVVGVDIKREPHPSDNPAAIGTDGLVMLGRGVFIEGARPDVEKAYPGRPLNYRAGWGFMVLTNYLPNQGNGTFVLHAIARDREGNATHLGQTTITGANAGSALPFGTIDTPAQGGVVSGSAYRNWAWALTPQPNMIPLDGSTLRVWVNGQALGRPNYGYYRSDIATLFPDYKNTDNAVGYFELDTTRYENGLHTINWSVADDAGNATAIGSRFFRVQNKTGAAEKEFESSGMAAGKAWGSPRPRSLTIDGIMRLPLRFDAVGVKTGYSENVAAEAAAPDQRGIVRLAVHEVDRIEIALGDGAAAEPGVPVSETPPLTVLPVSRNHGRPLDTGVAHTGFLVVGDELRTLPIGSRLDPRTGLFTWQLGPGFLGEYTLVFLRDHNNGLNDRITVKITVVPRSGSS
ncbi:MAG: hypothetical protein SCM96_05425 [Acidobacteriota bacterium]|nr:hypothetical protein [Acidobacteriota bacterium]